MAKGSKELLKELEEEVKSYLGKGQLNTAYLQAKSFVQRHEKEGSTNQEFYAGAAKILYELSQGLLGKPYKENLTKQEKKTVHDFITLSQEWEKMGERYEKERLEKKKIA